jgi:hypothetical protein
METAADFFEVVLYVVLSLLGTPVGNVLLGLIALLVLGAIYLVDYLVKRPDG